jgi:hypothetical protein
MVTGARSVIRWPAPHQVANFNFTKGARMNSKFSKTKVFAVIAALVAGVSGVAHADDNSMSIWNGDSYAAFNGGKDFPYGKPVFNTPPSTFHQTNPNGLSNREYQALSNEDPVWQIADPAAAAKLAASDTATAWRQSHPHGLTNREYQALSNEDPMWQLTPAESRAIAATDAPAVTSTATRQPSSVGIANLFNVSPASRTPSAY